MANLPTESQLISGSTTSAEQKSNLAALRNFLADLLGTDSSNKSAARTSLGLAGEGSQSYRNKIINGNFSINQRSVSGTVTLAAGAYGHDRWKAGASGCTYTFSTASNVTAITITAGSLMQVIEGINLQSGAHVLSWTGTSQGRIDSGAYGASGITGTAVGGTNQAIEFGPGTVRNVQYELGTVATPFEGRLYGMELALCQRYYEVIDYHVVSMNAISGNDCYTFAQFKVAKRVAPLSISGSDISSSGYPAGPPSFFGYVNGVRAVKTANGNFPNGFYSFSLAANSEIP